MLTVGFGGNWRLSPCPIPISNYNQLWPLGLGPTPSCFYFGLPMTLVHVKSFFVV